MSPKFQVNKIDVFVDSFWECEDDLSLGGRQSLRLLFLGDQNCLFIVAKVSVFK